MGRPIPTQVIRNGEKLFLKECTTPGCKYVGYVSGGCVRCTKCDGNSLKYVRSAKQGRIKSKRSIDNEGRAYQSSLERDRGVQLQQLHAAGEISDLSYQPGVTLLDTPVGRQRYKPDFTYIENGERIWEYAKGHETETFIINRKLWSLFGPGPLRITKRGHGKSIVVAETIIPKGYERRLI